MFAGRQGAHDRLEPRSDQLRLWRKVAGSAQVRLTSTNVAADILVERDSNPNSRANVT
jgi:hypothetical protein